MKWFKSRICFIVIQVNIILSETGRRQLPLGAETPRNIHEDLEVSESDEDSDGGNGAGGGGGNLSDDDGVEQNAPQTQQQQPDDDGLWF